MSKIIILWIAGLCCLNVSAETDDVYARAQEIAIILENIDTSPLENKLQADRPVWPSDLNPRANEKLEIRSLRELEEYIHTLPSARQFRLMDLSIQQAEWLLQNLREGLGKAKGERQTAEVYVFPTAGALVSLGLLVFFKGPKSELLSRLFCLSGLAIGSGAFVMLDESGNALKSLPHQIQEAESFLNEQRRLLALRKRMLVVTDASP